MCGVAAAFVAVGGYAIADTGGNSCSPGTRSSTGYTATCSVTVAIPASLIPAATVTATQTVTHTVTATPSGTSHPSSSTSHPSSSSASHPPSTSSSPPPQSGFPNGSNTGVPAGTTLTAYTGAMTITTPNAVIDSKSIVGQVVIKAPGVVIKNSRIGTDSAHAGDVYVDTDSMPSDTAWSVTIQDSEIDYGTAGYFGAVCCGNFTVLRSNVHGGQTAVQCDMDSNGSSCDVEDSWLHGQLDGGPVGTRHLGGFLSDGASNITVIHSTLACDHPVENGQGCTGDLNMIPHFAAVTNVLIQDNLFVANNTGNAYCTYGGSGNVEHSSASDNIVYKNNTFQRGHGGSAANSCADYGPVTFYNTSAPGNVWSGNVWDDGSSVPPAS